MLTEILMQEAVSVIDYDGKLRKRWDQEKMSQIEYNTNRANAKKASREALVKELKAAKEELIKSAEDELKKGVNRWPQHG